MINFANPEFLYALIAIPVIAALYILARFSRRKKLLRFGRHYNVDTLMPDASRYLPNIKIILQLAALTFIIIAASRPYVHTEKSADLKPEEVEVSGIELMICCDVSNSMLASSTTDVNGLSRLDRAKLILDKALDKMTNDRVGLIVFAGDAYLQLPITPDISSAKMYVNTLSPEMVPFQGTAIGAAINTAVNSFDPESAFNKAIVVITDGENFEDDAVKAAQKAAEVNIQVDVIGMGTAEKMPIPFPGGGFMVYDGEEVKTGLDTEGAAAIAKAGNGIYISGNAANAVNDLDVQLGKIKATKYSKNAIPSDSSDLFPLFAALALLLLLLDVAIPYRKLKWLRNIKFFSKK